MRLLDAEALIYDNVAELVDFPDESLAPEYAILSHTWEQEEVLFQDIVLGPQHEIQPSMSYMRALRREAAVDQHNSGHFDFSSSDDTDTDMSDEESTTYMTTLPSVSNDSTSDASLNSDEDASSCLGSSSSNSRNDVDARLHTPHVKAGWNKVLNTCLQTLRDGLRYVWIDTCKSN